MLGTPRTLRPLALALIILSGLISTGCLRSVKDIDVDDKTSNITRVKGTKQLTERVFLRGEYGRQVAETTEAVVLSATGDFDDDRPERVRLDTIELDGPQTIGAEMELDSAALMVGFHMLNKEAIQLNGYAGVRRMQVDLMLTDENQQSYNYDGVGFGPTAAFEVVVPLTERLNIEVNLAISIQTSGDSSQYNENGIYLSYELLEHLNLFAGWHATSYENDQHDSSINLESEGVLYGVDFRF